MRLHRLTGNWKHVIAKFGMGDRTDCNMVALPAVDKNWVVQLRDFCFILSTMEEKRSFFLLPKCSGRPRYFPTPPSLSIPRYSLTLALTSGVVFDEKVIDDFCAFIIWPETHS